MIVRFTRHGGHFLTGIGDADKSHARQPFERPIIIAAPIAQAMTAGIEGEQGHEHRIRYDFGRVREWFGDAVGVRMQGIARVPCAKDECRMRTPTASPNHSRTRPKSYRM